MDVHSERPERVSAKCGSVNSETLEHVVTRAAAVITRATDTAAVIVSESAIVRLMDRGRLFSPFYRGKNWRPHAPAPPLARALLASLLRSRAAEPPSLDRAFKM